MKSTKNGGWMKVGGLWLIGSIVFLSAAALAGEWKPAAAPLMTPWAGDVDPDNCWPEYPRPQMVRKEWKNLNGLWQWQAEKAGDPLPAGRELSEQILVPFCWESALSGIRRYLPGYRAVYRRMFTVPETWDGRRIHLNFEAVDWEAKVYVNGQCVGIHQGGYDPFYFDITDYLKKEEDQELIVRVFDPGSEKAIARGKQTNNRFDDPHGYTYTCVSGIWQTVWLEPVAANHIENFYVVPDLDQQRIAVTVMPEDNWGQVEVTVKNGSRTVAAGKGKVHERIFIPVPNPKTWSPTDPFLYDLEIIFKSNEGEVMDRVEGYFGMRKISLFTEDNGIPKLYLNNRFLFQIGPLDQGYWPDGLYTAPTDEALKWDVQGIKDFGYNMVRKHIKVEPRRWFYWCDKLGLMVWQDMPSIFGIRNEREKTQFETELVNMVRTHWNSPSIIQWIVFNEHWGIYDCHRLTTNVMQLDPSRLVTGNSGIDAGKPDLDFEVGHIKDNHHYRAPACPMASSVRAIVNGEYGAIGYNVEGHIWDPNGPWVHYNYEGKEAATAEYEKFAAMLVDFRKEGLSGAVYTQWTDLENEMNGLYTYDRKVIKLDKDRVRAANRSMYEMDLAGQ